MITSAVGDGIADDTAAIQAAFDKAAARGERAVELDARTYLVGPLTMPNGLTVLGKARGATVLKLKPASNAPVLANVSPGSDIGIRNLTVDGDKANQSVSSQGIHMIGVANLVLSGVEVRNAKGMGIQVNGNGLFTGPAQIGDISVHDNTNVGFYIRQAQRRSNIAGILAENNGGEGAYFDASQMTVVGVQARNNGNSGIRLRNLTGGVFSGFRSEGNKKHGIQVAGVRHSHGDGWLSQNNSTLEAGVYDDVCFALNDDPAGYGETAHGMFSMVVGPNPQIGGPFTSMIRKELWIEDGVNERLTIHVQASGDLGAAIRLPAVVGTLTVIGG